jgi:cytochrome c
MDKKNWLMAAVTVSALVLAFTVVPALADDPDDASPQGGHGDWAEMVEACHGEDGVGHMEDHDHDAHGGDHMDECLAGDGGGMMGGGMMGGGMMGW